MVSALEKPNRAKPRGRIGRNSPSDPKPSAPQPGKFRLSREAKVSGDVNPSSSFQPPERRIPKLSVGCVKSRSSSGSGVRDVKQSKRGIFSRFAANWPNRRLLRASRAPRTRRYAGKRRTRRIPALDEPEGPCPDELCPASPTLTRFASRVAKGARKAFAPGTTPPAGKPSVQFVPPGSLVLGGRIAEKISPRVTNTCASPSSSLRLTFSLALTRVRTAKR